MQSGNSNGSRAAPARGFMALLAMLAMGLGTMASPAEAAPFAYVTGGNTGIVSVIDTATTPPSVVATVTVGNVPGGVAVAPDGKHAYVTNPGATPSDGTVLVIATATNTVVATIPVGNFPSGVAVTPDGKHAYVTNYAFDTVSVIDTATNTVGTSIPVPSGAGYVAITPDGKHAYVTDAFSNTVSVIDTASNMVVATVPVGITPSGVAIIPDGKHAYVAAGIAPGTVSVIDTTSNTVVATVVVSQGGGAVAVTPDGKHAYVTNLDSKNVSAIDTATNTVVAMVPVGNFPIGVAIVPPPPGIPFLAFDAALVIGLGGTPNLDTFAVYDSFTLSSTAPGINPLTDAVTLQAGTFAVTIPPGSFVQSTPGNFVFLGSINGVGLEAAIAHTGTLRYVFEAKGGHASFTGTQNPAYVTLTIGGDSGATSVTAHISH